MSWWLCCGVLVTELCFTVLVIKLCCSVLVTELCCRDVCNTGWTEGLDVDKFCGNVAEIGSSSGCTNSQFIWLYKFTVHLAVQIHSSSGCTNRQYIWLYRLAVYLVVQLGSLSGCTNCQFIWLYTSSGSPFIFLYSLCGHVRSRKCVRCWTGSLFEIIWTDVRAMYKSAKGFRPVNQSCGAEPCLGSWWPLSFPRIPSWRGTWAVSPAQKKPKSVPVMNQVNAVQFL